MSNFFFAVKFDAVGVLDLLHDVYLLTQFSKSKCPSIFTIEGHYIENV